MAKRLIDADEIESLFYAQVEHGATDLMDAFDDALQDATTVDAVELPCKIGDYVWAIRNFNGHKHPQRGVVSDMYFTRDMQLNIVVKYVARGKWGETVFATDAEAYAVIKGEIYPCKPDIFHLTYEEVSQ